MVDRFLEEPRWVDPQRVGVNGAEEEQRPVVPNQPVGPIGPPGRLVEPVLRVRVKPAHGQVEMIDRSLARERRQTIDQCRANALVTLDQEDPVARALRMQPPIDAFDVRELEREYTIRHRRIPAQILR